MNIATILATKGGQVFTGRPDQTVRQALALLAEHNVGALVIVDADGPRRQTPKQPQKSRQV